MGNSFPTWHPWIPKDVWAWNPCVCRWLRPRCYMKRRCGLCFPHLCQLHSYWSCQKSYSSQILKKTNKLHFILFFTLHQHICFSVGCSSDFRTGVALGSPEQPPTWWAVVLLFRVPGILCLCPGNPAGPVGLWDSRSLHWYSHSQRGQASHPSLPWDVATHQIVGKHCPTPLAKH